MPSRSLEESQRDLASRRAGPCTGSYRLAHAETATASGCERPAQPSDKSNPTAEADAESHPGADTFADAS